MIFTSARLALADIFSEPFRAALWKMLGLSAVVLVGLWFAIGFGFESYVLPLVSDLFPQLPAWVDQIGSAAVWGLGFVLAIGLAFLIGPISAIIAGLFLDDVAEVVETRSYPGSPRGVEMPILPGMILSIKFFGIVILGNLLAFALLLVPGINLIAFFVVNGYLLGREYFEFAALRYRGEEAAREFRERHRSSVFLAGLVVAAFLSVPFLNVLTPLFAASFMVHLHQRLAARDGGLVGLGEEAVRLGAR
ncbi:sulfate transporter family protein [Fulvimarina endophytica]|uniref:Sulfate transporter family protein n=1 Tax=Fulvimarina endophytica TaxID=2293836 RepID=A0A371X4B5_9HYPH|nr:sulfate transporter family protein [Fulvimarina endophytica]RFC64071.1 sulfate transporter family protein [Fulvimarina endophytica]